MALAGLVALGVPGAGADPAQAQSPLTVVITEAELDWSPGEHSSMTWQGFGSGVSEDSRCRPQVIGAAITTIRFELVFDLSTDPATLSGTLQGSGDWRNPAVDDPAYGREWAAVSFSGPIVDGWARETPDGWAWGGTADLVLDFAGLRICSIDLDEQLQEVYVVAEGSGQRQLAATFTGGVFGGGYHGFDLNGSSTAGYWEPGDDVWSLSLGCTGCDLPVGLPVGGGGPVPGSGSVFGVPPWLGGGVVGSPPVGGGGEPGVQSDEGEGAAVGEWDPLGVAILILLVALVVYLSLAQVPGLRRAEAEAQAGAAAVAVALEPGSARVPSPPSAREAAVLAEQMTVPGPEGWGRPLVTPSSPVQPWSSPDEGAGRAGFVLQPGQCYEEVGSTGGGPGDWVLVRHQSDPAGEGRLGWVHRSALEPWREQVVSRPAPPGWGAPYRWRLRFPEQFLTRDPAGGNLTRRPPGEYGVGPPGADGYRPVYDLEGKLLGSILADQVPPQPVTAAGHTAPPPPPPP